MTLLTVRETAELLRVSQITVRRHIAAGTLQAVRIGRSVRVIQESVDRALQPELKPEITSLGFVKGDPMDFDDPLFNIIGIGSSVEPTDIAKDKDEYLAEAYADLHEDK